MYKKLQKALKYINKSWKRHKNLLKPPKNWKNLKKFQKLRNVRKSMKNCKKCGKVGKSIENYAKK